MSRDSANRISPPSAISFDNARQFTCFPKLPYEIKTKIWKFATLGLSPRVVYVTQDDYIPLNTKHLKTRQKSKVIVCRAKGTCRTPTLLHTCFHSREVALKVYRLCFYAAFGSRPVYFDFSRDELVMKNAYVLHSFNEAETIRRPAELTVPESQDKLRFLTVGEDTLFTIPSLLECYYKLDSITLKRTSPGSYRSNNILRQENWKATDIRKAWQKKLGADDIVILPTIQFVEESMLQEKILQAKAPVAIIERNELNPKKRKRGALPAGGPSQQSTKGQDFNNPIVID